MAQVLVVVVVGEVRNVVRANPGADNAAASALPRPCPARDPNHHGPRGDDGRPRGSEQEGGR